MEMYSIIVMSILIEAIITYTKTLVIEKNIQWQIIAAVILSIVICLLYGLDIPALVGIKSPVPYVGSIITGILVSRGSNYIYDLIKMLTSKKKSVSTEIFGSDGSDGVEI